MKKTVRDGFNTIPAASQPQPVQKESGKSLLICVTLVLLFIIILLVCIRMDVGGFGTKVLRPILKDVPVVKHVLPEATDEEIASETGYRSLAQAVTKIEQLEQELAELKAQQESQTTSLGQTGDASLQAEIDSLKEQIETLKVYESNQKNFETMKEKFYEEVVYNDNVDVSDYTKWYEEMDKDTAAKLYKEAVKTQELSEFEKKMAETYAEMKPAKAAAILNTMTGDVDTVVNILNAMDAKARGEIMAEMNPTFAAKITKKMTS